MKNLSVNELQGLIRTVNALYAGINMQHITLANAKRHIENAGINDALALGLTVTQQGRYYDHDFFHLPVREHIRNCINRNRADTLLMLNALRIEANKILTRQ
ncbi:Uncharacterised protein [Yersinia aldovae]|uniref:hypothetical protein n=1 Tax=Yersinia aldovae TaxID=29483 RepID=UPI0005DFDDA6|nr:hypothetical protein [Yersinia aldovae]CNK26355.1 Uncharacterised protein [Yersinia aldovae]